LFCIGAVFSWLGWYEYDNRYFYALGLARGWEAERGRLPLRRAAFFSLEWRLTKKITADASILFAYWGWHDTHGNVTQQHIV